MQDGIPQFLLDPLMGKAVAAVLGLVVVYVLTRFVVRRVTPRIEDVDTRYRVRKLITFFAYLVAALVLVIVFSERIGTFGVTFGVAGAGIAFALQEVIASVAGWGSITFGSAFRVGDRIQLGGIVGDVIDIGVLRTTLMETGGWINGDQYNGRIVRVANSFVFKDPVTNYTADFPFLWDEIDVPIRHGSDVEMARAMLLGAAEDLIGDYARGAQSSWKQVVNRYRIENAQVIPMVMLRVDENWMTFTLRYVVDYSRRRSTRDRLWTRILHDIKTSRGDVSLAYRTLAVEAPLDVRLRTETAETNVS